MTNKQRLLITGGTGRLARNWAAAMSPEMDIVLADRFGTQSRLPVQHAQVDLSDKRSLTKQVLDIRPEVVVHAAGLADVERCQEDPESAYEANVVSAGNVAEVCAFLDVPLVHISTDHLFAQGTGLFDEAEVPEPVNVYGQTKAEAEMLVLNRYPGALVLRANFFGHDAPGRYSMSSWILASLRANEPVRLFDDVFFTPVLASNLAKDALDLVARGVSGVVNIASKDRVSKYEFGLELCEEFGLDESLVVAQSIRSRPDLVARPQEMSLCTEKRDEHLGKTSKTVREHLRDLKAEEKRGVGETTVKNRTPYGRHQIRESDVDAVALQMRVGSLTQGDKISDFERAIADRVNAEYAVAVSSGTAGLHLAAIAGDLGVGSQLVTSAVSFVSSANAARFVGAGVNFADIDQATLNMTAETLSTAASLGNDHFDAVVAVHMAGLSADMQAIRDVASERSAVVIEDAAHALGGMDLNGNPVGSCSHSDMTVFSLHPVKSIAAGEGGVITTNSSDLHQRLLRLRSHGINKGLDSLVMSRDPITGDRVAPWRYEMLELGFNFRFTDLQAALALSQLDRLDDFIARRRDLALLYDLEFSGSDLIRPYHEQWRSWSAHHLYIVAVDFDQITLSRGELMHALTQEGFITQVHYVPIPAHPYYREAGHTTDNVPNAIHYYRSALSIPLFVDLRESEARRFSKTLMDLVERHRTADHAEQTGVSTDQTAAQIL